MKQTYHANATTNVQLRNEINKSNLTNLQLSEHYNVSQNTVFKWKTNPKYLK